MVTEDKLSAIIECAKFARFRKSIGAKSVKRTEIVVLAENTIKQQIVLTRDDMETIARMSNGTYVSGVRGKSRIEFA